MTSATCRRQPFQACPGESRGAGLAVVEAQFVFGHLEAVLDGPAPSFHSDQHRNRRAGGAPGGEKGRSAISDITADHKAPGPQTGRGLVVFGRLKIGQFQEGPVEQPLALAAGPADNRCPAEGSSVSAIAAAVPAIGGLLPQELNWLMALTRAQGPLNLTHPMDIVAGRRPPRRTAPPPRWPARPWHVQGAAWSQKAISCGTCTAARRTGSSAPALGRCKARSIKP